MLTSYEHEKDLDRRKKHVELSVTRDQAREKCIRAEVACNKSVWRAGIWRVFGPCVAIHLIWAAAIVAMTWIWVVRGWRG